MPRMDRQRTHQAIIIAAALGAAAWWITSVLNGSREAWDGAGYWSLAYPLSILACALLGYRYPIHAWRWAGVMFLAQFVAMCVRNGEPGCLWPIGLLMFAVLALPGVTAAMIAAAGIRSADKRGRVECARNRGSFTCNPLNSNGRRVKLRLANRNTAMTILDNRRKALDTRIEWLQDDIHTLQASLQSEIETLRAEAQERIYRLQIKRREEIDALQATLARRKAERRELDDYVPAVDPASGDDVAGEATD